MKLKEIINRPNDKPVDQDEMIYVVEKYIKDRKGKDVNIVINTNEPSIMIAHKLQTLMDMFNIAVGWYRNNKVS